MTVARWEHRFEVVHLSGKDHDASRGAAEAALDALGADGWEVVGFSPANAASHGLHVETTEYVVLLKRQVRGRS